MSRSYVIWGQGEKTKILKSLAAARKKVVKGLLKAIYLKYGITAQHEVAWLKQKAAKSCRNSVATASNSSGAGASAL